MTGYLILFTLFDSVRLDCDVHVLSRCYVVLQLFTTILNELFLEDSFEEVLVLLLSIRQQHGIRVASCSTRVLQCGKPSVLTTKPFESRMKFINSYDNCSTQNLYQFLEKVIESESLISEHMANKGMLRHDSRQRKKRKIVFSSKRKKRIPPARI
ncbi:hypothetical protein CEXT_766571 [Caerostris extrusa]|uniref:Uncharacterized protein n=1 Tax=Caerostris extrusa TaxID=172846 RepID=A0AAV4RX45_CAEEX|nr:hypothetical protein CEXT_766571 [Caerostris extrusa]